MEERSTFHPLDYVSVLRRRKWWFIAPLAAALIVGALLALLLPRTYFSHARIGVASATLSPELLRGVTSMQRDERQRAISQQLLSPAVLERVVREEKINPEKPVSEVAAWLRSNVQVSVPVPMRGTDTRAGSDTFDLGYQDSSPEQAQRIANRLAYVFVEENSKTRINRFENTSEVLSQQLADSQARLNQLEQALMQKKQSHMGSLPDQVNSNISVLNGLRSSADSLANQIRSEQDRLTVIESQIASMQQGTGGGALTSSAASAIQAANTRINQLTGQLNEARAAGYTDKHPAVTLLQQEIADARKELQTAQKQSAGNGPDALRSDPAYAAKVTERDMARLRIRQLQNAEAQARGQIAQFQRRVESAPMVEQDLSAVTRDVLLEQDRYKKLKTEYEAAKSAEDLQRKEGGERFSVLYGAYLPGSPASPVISKVMLMSLALGLVLGAGLVVAREFLDRSVHDAKALQNEFEIPVLGEIPKIHGAAQAGLSH